MQNDITAVEGWGRTNRLPFDLSNCKVVTIARISIYASTYSIGGDSTIDRVDVIRDLGLTLNSQFTFKDHITAICKKANPKLGFIMGTGYRFNNRLTDSNIALMLYNAYIPNVLEFGAVVWDLR